MLLSWKLNFSRMALNQFSSNFGQDFTIPPIKFPCSKVLLHCHFVYFYFLKLQYNDMTSPRISLSELFFQNFDDEQGEITYKKVRGIISNTLCVIITWYTTGYRALVETRLHQIYCVHRVIHSTMYINTM